MDTKALKLQIKNTDGEGTFDGFLAVYGNVDEQGDLIEPGAFGKTLKDSGGRVPLLWQHKSDEPLGWLDLSDSPKGLRVRGQLLKDEIGKAKEAWTLVRAGVIKGLSIGYRTVRQQVKNGVRHLLEIALHEGSLVTFPANPAAVVTAVKAEEDDPELAEWKQRRREMLETAALTGWADIRLFSPPPPRKKRATREDVLAAADAAASRLRRRDGD